MKLATCARDDPFRSAMDATASSTISIKTVFATFRLALLLLTPVFRAISILRMVLCGSVGQEQETTSLGECNAVSEAEPQIHCFRYYFELMYFTKRHNLNLYMSVQFHCSLSEEITNDHNCSRYEF